MTALCGPDFIIIGAMKAGTTTLFRWLEEHPGCHMPEVKEPEFFIDERWPASEEEYLALFEREPGMISGEASVGYTDPAVAEVAASRMADAAPHLKLIFLARNPAARLRSHYRHEVQRGREAREFGEALRTDSEYVRRSLYSKATGPFAARFPSSQLRVVVFEDLYGAENSSDPWEALLDFLGLETIAPPEAVANVTANKQGFSRLALWAWDRGIRSVPEWVPGWVRRGLRRSAFRDGPAYRRLLESSQEEIDTGILELLEEDVELFVDLVEIDRPWGRLEALD